MIGEALRAALAGQLGSGPCDCAPVGGGDINRAFRVETSDEVAFLKLNAPDLAGMFAAEAAALEEIAASGSLRVPAVLAHGVTEDGSFLLLEHLELRPGDARAAEDLGRGLAAMHGVVATVHGWQCANFIGSTPQRNDEDADWARFWREQRLRPQLELAGRNGLGAGVQRAGEALLAGVEALLAGHSPAPSLLHGDLWGGNWSALPDGTPVVYDPASYHGDAEADLAMTRLFGGFPAPFYDAYHELRPASDGWELRDGLYRLYHVLNHANLFGGGYVGQAERLMGRLASA